MNVARRPEECGRIYADLLKAARLDDLVAMYEPGATVVLAGGEQRTGHAAIREWLAQLLAAAMIELDLKVVKLVEIDGLAIVHTDWWSTLSLTDTSVMASSGKALEVVRRQPDGRWLYAIDDPFGRG